MTIHTSYTSLEKPDIGFPAVEKKSARQEILFSRRGKKTAWQENPKILINRKKGGAKPGTLRVKAR
jgi:hypothetical protein